MLSLNPNDFEIAGRLVVATLLGALIGLERESHRKDAGFRTYSLVSLGSALVMVVSVEVYNMYHGSTDPSRIAAQVVSGIGFLGAGAIIRSPSGGSAGRDGVKGLTTAAGIWAASGIGLSCGIGLYTPALITTALTLIVLMFFSRINRLVGGKDKNITD